MENNQKLKLANNFPMEVAIPPKTGLDPITKVIGLSPCGTHLESHREIESGREKQRNIRRQKTSNSPTTNNKNNKKVLLKLAPLI